jgi:hypothetical protein
VFYGGKPPKGIKTNWIMHEYRLLSDHNRASNMPPGCHDFSNKKNSLRVIFNFPVVNFVRIVYLFVRKTQ